MNAQRNYHRRTILIKKGFQFQIVLVVVLLFTTAALLVWWEVYQSFLALSRFGLLADPNVMAIIHDIGETVALKLAIAEGLVILIALLLSHFIAGPIYRIEKSLGLLKSGNLTHRIHLRKHDQLTNLAASFNDTIEGLQQTLQRDRERLDAAVRALEKTDLTNLDGIIRDLKQVNKTFTI